MFAITMKTMELLQIVRRNRKAHYELWLVVDANYRNACVAEFNTMIEMAQSCCAVPRALPATLPAPRNHLEDYDTALAMLEAATNEEIDVDQNTYETLVLDKWLWSAEWCSSSSSYSSSSSSSDSES